MIPLLARFWILPIILVLLSYHLPAQEGTDGERLYQAFVERKRDQTELFIRKLTPLQRQMVIDHVRYLQTQETHGKNYGDDTLFFMGDPAVRKRYLEEIRKHPRGPSDVLRRSGDPTLIEAIAPDIFVDEPMRNVGGDDTPAAPTSFRMADYITYLLKNSPDFREDVRQWAGKQSGCGGGDEGVEFREVMRQWWRDNEKFFKEKNYQAVRPGHDFIQEMRDRAASAEAAYQAAQTKASGVAPSGALPTPLPAGATPTPRARPSQERIDFGHGILVITIGLAALAAGFLYFAKRSK